MISSPQKHIYFAVLVAALGYFVDVYDLVLFSVVRSSSLSSLGVQNDTLLSDGVYLLNMQMTGMLLGGILWGIWGDKRGRVSVLFGSIVLYSLANIANGLVDSVSAYGWCRIVAGIGLAGELGAGITLVSEVMPIERRGLGTTFVASLGVAGAIVAALVGDLLSWRVAYFVGGGMGLALLVLRVIVHESGMFKQSLNEDVSRGNLLLLFKSKDRLIRYLCSILIGVPIWFIVGILFTFAPEFGKNLNMVELPTGAGAILYGYIGFVLGDISSGLLSQALKSRKKAILVFLLLAAITCFTYFNSFHVSLSHFYLICGTMGFAGGYWAVFVTTAAEQFGTNLRATVATTVPNFVRGSVVLVSSIFVMLKGEIGILQSGLYVGAGCILVALIALYHLKESFSNDLDFFER